MQFTVLYVRAVIVSDYPPPPSQNYPDSAERSHTRYAPSERESVKRDGEVPLRVRLPDVGDQGIDKVLEDTSESAGEGAGD